MFYHDHSWGITRLNVYAGEAAGYTITDNTEKALVNSGLIPTAADTLPLIVQDRTFVPGRAAEGHGRRHRQRDEVRPGPTWDESRWGTKGSFWYHHVYMPAQNPGDPGGMSGYGRWMYGPWFWPPATGTTYGPIANPYYDPSCTLDDPSTWTYDTDPFCEPEQIPGTPNVSAGMEQFNDTPIVNGVAYPTTTLQPKTYRMRLLNAANDRFFNFQWYTADPDPANGNGQSEVKLKAAELAAAQTDPVVSPTPEGANNDAYGPDWVQIAQRGWLPARAGSHRRPAADDLDHRPDPLRCRQRRQALAAAGAGRAGGRHRRLLEVRRQDADPLQRRACSLPGAGPVVRLLHGWP